MKLASSVSDLGYGYTIFPVYTLYQRGPYKAFESKRLSKQQNPVKAKNIIGERSQEKGFPR